MPRGFLETCRECQKARRQLALTPAKFLEVGANLGGGEGAGLAPAPWRRGAGGLRPGAPRCPREGPAHVLPRRAVTLARRARAGPGARVRLLHGRSRGPGARGDGQAAPRGFLLRSRASGAAAFYGVSGGLRGPVPLSTLPPHPDLGAAAARLL